MPTTNYNLPLLEQTAAFDLVTDYNALSNTVDSVLKTQLSNINALISGNTGDITEINSQLTTINNTLNSINSTLSNTNDTLNNLFNFTAQTLTNIDSEMYNACNFVLMINQSKTLFKLGGSAKEQTPLSDSAYNLTSIPGSNNLYGDKVIVPSGTFFNTPPSSALLYTNTSMSRAQKIESANGEYSAIYIGAGFCIGTDGNLYINVSNASTRTLSANLRLNVQLYQLFINQGLFTLQNLHLQYVQGD